jgi:RNA polymerase sigma-70 factor (ECF subfamily)
MTDEALMAAYQKGDLAAFSDLVARHEKPLWNFVRRFVRDAATAEDLLQEVFVRVIDNAGEWRPTAKVATWMYAIARNLCTDQARRASVRKTTPLGELAAPGGGSEAAAMDRQTAARIDEAVAGLPVEQREVFLMREVMDLPFAEIAIAVGASEPTVKSRMRYALERLREALDDFKDRGDGANSTLAPSAAGLGRTS